MYYNLRTDEVQTLRMGSEADRWGNEYPGMVAVPVWEKHRDFGKTLLEKCERLFETFGTVSGAVSIGVPAIPASSVAN